MDALKDTLITDEMRNDPNKATKAGNVEKPAERGVQEVQVDGKEMVFISSLGPAAKLQSRQGKKEELICKHLQWL